MTKAVNKILQSKNSCIINKLRKLYTIIDDFGHKNSPDNTRSKFINHKT